MMRPLQLFLKSWKAGPPPNAADKKYSQSQQHRPVPSKLASLIVHKNIAKVKGKLEAGGYHTNTAMSWMSNPTNDTSLDQILEEKITMLRQMGFTDRHEILGGLWHLQPSSRNIATMDVENRGNEAML